ncbi:MAG: hypothetical protein JSS30_01170 [Verrucomicrobia bacterium]|nr:hypothetical protein [Verrucomicrobiota bacterium]
MNSIFNIAAGMHLFSLGEQKCLRSPVDIPKGVAKIVVEFLNQEDMNSLLWVSKGWAAVVLEKRANSKLLPQLIRGFESLFEAHLKSIFVSLPNCIVEYTKFFAQLRTKTIQKNCTRFKLCELEQLHDLWEDYLQVRRIEYTFCQEVIRKGATLRYAPKKEVVWDDATCNMVIPFLNALIDEFRLEKARDAILFKYAPLIARALRRDGSLEWLEKLKKINVFVTTDLGKRLSEMEAAWHLDFRKLRMTK